MNMLTLRPNPNDARSKIVMFHRKGPYSIDRGIGFLKQQDAVMETIVGQHSLKAFHLTFTTRDSKIEIPSPKVNTDFGSGGLTICHQLFAIVTS